MESGRGTRIKKASYYFRFPFIPFIISEMAEGSYFKIKICQLYLSHFTVKQTERQTSSDIATDSVCHQTEV